MTQNHLKSVDWNAIKTDYLTGHSASALAKAHGVSSSAIYKRAKDEGWTRDKEQMDLEIAQRLIDKYPLDIARHRPEVLEELLAIGMSDIADYLTVDDSGCLQLKPFSQMPKGATRCIKVVKERKRVTTAPDGSQTIDSQIEYTLLDKLKALETLAKITGLFEETITVNNMPQIIAIQGLSDINSL